MGESEQANDETSDIEQMAADAVEPIGEELRRRLALELDDRGVLAIESALLKSFLNGMRAGASETTDRAMDQTGMMTGLGGLRRLGPAELDPELPWLDPFAERYGDG
jgi:hypothetical protein